MQGTESGIGRSNPYDEALKIYGNVPIQWLLEPMHALWRALPVMDIKAVRKELESWQAAAPGTPELAFDFVERDRPAWLKRAVCFYCNRLVPKPVDAEKLNRDPETALLSWRCANRFCCRVSGYSENCGAGRVCGEAKSRGNCIGGSGLARSSPPRPCGPIGHARL